MGEDVGDFRVAGERRDDMVALAAFVLGEALELELAPAEAVAQWARTNDRGLDALDRQGDVGQRQETAAAAQPRGGPVEPKAIVAQEGAGDSGGEPERDQQHASRQHRHDLVREDQVGDRRSGIERLAPQRRQALDAGSPIADLILAHQIVAVLAGSVLLVALGLATGVTRTFLRDYRFRLDRTATGLRRRRGLLTLTDVTLPIRRVQAAIIGSGPLRDRFGWSELKLQSLAKDEGSKGDHVVAPLARDAEIADILAELAWRPVDRAIEWRKVSRAYAWGFTFLVSLLLIPAIISLAVEPGVGALILLALPQ